MPEKSTPIFGRLSYNVEGGYFEEESKMASAND
jgi:hypothetical protein